MSRTRPYFQTCEAMTPFNDRPDTDCAINISYSVPHPNSDRRLPHASLALLQQTA